MAVFCASAAGAETLTYVLTPVPDRGELRVELTWQTAERSESRLCVAEHWGTVSDVPALLKDVTFEGASGVRRDKACWQVAHRLGAELHCRYTVDPGRRAFDWASTHHPITTETFFHGLGGTFLLTPAPGGGQPEEYEVIVRWKLPKGWRAVCSWGTGPSVGARLAPENVRQAVYLAGRLVMHTTDVPGAGELTVALLDKFGFSAAEFADFAAGIIAGQCAFMHEEHFPPFVVTAIPVGAAADGGELRTAGMGLYHSFALCLSPRANLSDGVEHLFAHELFHTWNGRLLRAADPEETAYWFTEGFTDYYALRILFESGRWKADTYARWLNRHLREYAANPARNATNDDIRDGFWKSRHTIGEAPYQRGLLLGLRWHKLARDHGVGEGFDRLLWRLVERARNAKFELSNDVLREEGRQILGDWFVPEFDRYVVRAETIDVPADVLAPELVGRVETVHAYELGFDRERSLRDNRVRLLVAGSAAAKAGLREGDELVDWEIPGEPDAKVQIQVRRAGKLRRLSYHPRGAPSQVFQLVPAP
jgi:predicted metalloprotease with PDZ domain